MKLVQKIVVGFFTVAGFSALAWAIVLDGLYARTMPSVAKPLEGRTYETWVHHGVHVFLTRGEYYTIEYLPTACVLLLAVAYVFYHHWQPRYRWRTNRERER